MCKAYAELAVDCCYAAFTFDFNGGGLMSKSSGKSVDMTVNTEVADLCAVIDYVKSLPEVDSSKITLLGCSQGGVVSAITAKKNFLHGTADKIVNISYAREAVKKYACSIMKLKAASTCSAESITKKQKRI